jgi:epoxyqueuosine reductase
LPTSIDAVELTEEVKRQARLLGFDLVGVTTPDPPAHFDVFEAWLAAGRHGEMTYLATERARQRRADPARILPECESILVVGANCRGQRTSAPGGHARIATYAQGEDYHTILVERLESLVAFIRDSAGVADLKHRIYTDTGPIMEREVAQRAGLGWIGKNTCLIHPGHGSHFLLAEIFLSVALVPDRPFAADRCGSCTRCIDACPTKCILSDRTLDATRCISYLTIEVKGMIPQDLRSPIGDWIFGCDVCQDVCPWNVRFGEPTTDAAFQPRAILAGVRPEDILELRPGDWKRGLGHTALVRPKRRGLVRNAAIVAGNLRQPESVQPLSHVLLGDPDPIARSHAAWALGQFSGSEARTALLQARSTEEDPQVQVEIEAAILRIEPGTEKKL